jgi:hypothetical protein
VLDVRVRPRVVEGLVAVFPADPVVLMTGLTEHLQDLSGHLVGADRMPVDDELVSSSS